MMDKLKRKPREAGESQEVVEEYDPTRRLTEDVNNSSNKSHALTHDAKSVIHNTTKSQRESIEGVDSQAGRHAGTTAAAAAAASLYSGWEGVHRCTQ